MMKPQSLQRDGDPVRVRLAGVDRPAMARQRGVALIIGLVILVVLALLGVSAYSVATQDERIAGNARDHSRAQDAAETMLRACEYYVESSKPVFDGSVPGMYPAPAAGGVWVGESTIPWTQPAYVLPNAATLNPEWSQAPQCLVEEFALSNNDKGVSPAGLPTQQQGPMRVAHVAARGYGLSKNTQVTLVSYFAFY
jgi:hypothetical protein